MRDNLAKRVRESYRLDDRRFREIIDRLDDTIEESRKTSEAVDSSTPAIILNLEVGEILVRAEYHTSGTVDFGKVLFDYVGRLVAGSRVGNSKKGGLYLQTFNPPDSHLGAVPHPYLVQVLKEYIV